MFSQSVLWLLLFSTTSVLSSKFAELPFDLEVNVTRPYKVRPVKFLCVEQPYKYTEVHVCNMKLRRNKPAVLNLHFTFTRPTNTMFLAFQVNFKYTTYQPFLMQFDIDLCKYFAEEWNKGTNKVADFAINFTTSQVSWISKCPYYGRYNITDFELRPETLPKFLPAGDYRLDARHYDKDNNTLMYFQIFMNVRAKGLFDLSMG